MVVVYPLSAAEDLTIRCVSRIVPVVAIAVILLLGAMSAASA
jgi:hypothetical protein